MTKAQPASEPEHVVLTFKYHVSDKYIERQISETGQRPAKVWEVAFDLTELTDRQLRALLRRAHEIARNAPWHPELEEPTDDPEVLAHAIYSRKAAEPAEEDRDAEAYDAAMTAWIEQHGSPRLRRAHHRGYKSNRTYVLERVKAELPGFWVDLTDQSSAAERANPTSAALDLEDEAIAQLRALGLALPVRIVTLNRPPRDMETELGPHAYGPEAIAIRGWLGRYDLYLPVDPDLRAPEGDDVDD